jgi:hypothetical protein
MLIRFFQTHETGFSFDKEDLAETDRLISNGHATFPQVAQAEVVQEYSR